ncbi:hypothetical protein GCM10010174_73710 [Kutzneria viridogrisea]|uniref:Coenzyme PQQ synthesis protein D (PqqD) n=2 Tax=Kutzneria TaxID=43356 RepID=W5W891_9PSEU|nr:lasso peptide biosynthesis PqqD family chaperone [Kutzneria albida]AHH96970.1 hypothetical protein KALB_3606 [Kutzneria albida DSM 43870]MBA8932065.1 hypothetical protein [Kutzneria viridogrisea]
MRPRMVELRENIVFTETSYGGVLLDERAGQFWSLNPTAALALRVLLEQGHRDQAVTQITEHYEVSSGTAGADVDDLLAQLGAAGLLKTRPA